MMYRLSKDRGGDNNCLRFAAFPIRDANFVEIKHEFGYPALYVIVQILNCSLEKRSRPLRALAFLRATRCLDDRIRMAKNDGIYQSSTKSDL
jgi:hypothetical protein